MTVDPPSTSAEHRMYRGGSTRAQRRAQARRDALTRRIRRAGGTRPTSATVIRHRRWLRLAANAPRARELGARDIRDGDQH
jgi:hypothetical protein